MAAVDVDPKGRFSQEMVKKMNEMGLTIRDVAEKSEATYEHIRRLAHGAVFPSSLMLKEICAILGINPELAKKLATADKIEQKYGSVANVLAGQNPELIEIEKSWVSLQENQKQDIIAMVQALARKNRNSK